MGKEARDDTEGVEHVPDPDSAPVSLRYQTEVGSLTRKDGGEAPELGDLILFQTRKHALRVKFHVKQSTAAKGLGRQEPRRMTTLRSGSSPSLAV